MGSSAAPTSIAKSDIDPWAKAQNTTLYNDAVRYLNNTPYQAYGPASSMVAGYQPMQNAARQYMIRGLLGPNAQMPGFAMPTTLGGPYSFGDPFRHGSSDSGGGGGGGGGGTPGGDPGDPSNPEDGADENREKRDPYLNTTASGVQVASGAMPVSRQGDPASGFSMQGLVDQFMGQLGPGRNTTAPVPLSDALAKNLFGERAFNATLDYHEVPSRFAGLVGGRNYDLAKELFSNMSDPHRQQAVQDALTTAAMGRAEEAQPMFDFLSQQGINHDWSSIPRYSTTQRDDGQYVDYGADGNPVFVEPQPSTPPVAPPTDGGGGGAGNGGGGFVPNFPGGGGTGTVGGGNAGGGTTWGNYTLDPSTFGQGVGSNELQAGTQATAGLLGYTPQQVDAGSLLGGPGIGAYQNPYTQQVVNSTLGDIERSRQLATQDIAGRATMARAFGGSRHGVAEAETNRAYADRAAQTTAALRSQGFDTAAGLYGQDLNRGLQAGVANQTAGIAGGELGLNAAAQMGQFGNQMFGNFLTGGNALFGLGSQDQGLAQQLIDADIQQFYEARNDPLRGLNLRQGILQGMPMSQTFTQYQPQSRTQGILQGALGGAGVGAKFGPWGAGLGAIGGGLLGLL